MEMAEVISLMKVIKRSYPQFDTSPDSVQHHFKFLRDFPSEVALGNIESHIRTERFPPTIADIRGRLGDRLDSKRSKDETAAYFAQLDEWERNASPPPPGWLDGIRAKLRGEVKVE